MNILKVRDVITRFNQIANPGLAYSWDNVGLQVGDSEWEVKKVLVTLDVTENAINKAIKENADMIISHHPFLFKAIKKVTNPLIIKLIQNKIAVYCAHTNLDTINNGVNYILANKLELKNLEILSQDSGAEWFHVSVYLAEGNLAKVANAVTKAGAGLIGKYKKCINYSDVVGQFEAQNGANPVIGEIEKLEIVNEKKLEFFVDSFNKTKVIKAMKKAHTYDEPAYTIIKLNQSNPAFGLGFIGELEEETTIEEFSCFVKKALKTKALKLWLSEKKLETKIRRIAICGGSGSSLLHQVYGRADLFISGDFTYHHILDSKIPLIDAGHFNTEYPVIDFLETEVLKLDLEVCRLSIDEHEINKLLIF